MAVLFFSGRARARGGGGPAAGGAVRGGGGGGAVVHLDGLLALGVGDLDQGAVRTGGEAEAGQVARVGVAQAGAVGPVVVVHVAGDQIGRRGHYPGDRRHSVALIVGGGRHVAVGVGDREHDAVPVVSVARHPAGRIGDVLQAITARRVGVGRGVAVEVDGGLHLAGGGVGAGAGRLLGATDGLCGRLHLVAAGVGHVCDEV